MLATVFQGPMGMYELPKVSASSTISANQVRT